MKMRMIIPGMALLFLAGTGAGSLPEPPECVEAAAWVRAHADALPATLAALSEFTPVYRRTILDALPVETRVSLWREHLEGFLAPQAGLDDRQRAGVREVIERLPALHTPGSGAAEARALGARVVPLFPPEAASRIFTEIGPAPAERDRTHCYCSMASSVECPGGECVSASCRPLATGCGVGGAEPCDGFCLF